MARIAYAAFAAAVMLSIAPARADDVDTCNNPTGQTGIDACTRLIDSGNLNADDRSIVFYNRGVAYDDLGQHARAIQDYNEAIRLKPGNEVAYAFRGAAYEALGQHALAILDYDEAIYLKPDYAEALGGRCWARAVQGKGLDLALADCNEAVRLAPANILVHCARGLVSFKTDNYARAIADYDSALAIDPKSALAVYLRGLAKLKAGDVSGGKADIAAAKKIWPGIAEAYAGDGIKP